MASRTILFSLALFLVAVQMSQSQDAKKDKQAEKDLDKLQGAWEVVECIEHGRANADVIGKLRFVFTGDKLSVFQDREVKNFMLKLNEKASPKSLDTTALEGEVIGEVTPGIYRFDGEKLQICIPNHETEKKTPDRPKEFAAAKGSVNALITLKKATKKS